MEYFDIYTVHGRPTGRTAPKGYACAEGEFYLGVHVYLYDSQGRFLLQRRAEDKSFRPGEWDIHMGHAMAGETSLQTARREVQEELGLLFDPEQFIHVSRTVWHGERSLVDVYFVRADVDETCLRLQAEEVIGVKWVTKEEMTAFVRTTPWRPEHYRQAVLQYMADVL